MHLWAPKKTHSMHLPLSFLPQPKKRNLFFSLLIFPFSLPSANPNTMLSLQQLLISSLNFEMVVSIRNIPKEAPRLALFSPNF